MAYSSVTIPADGTTDTFTFSFKYLSLTHISAYKNGILIPGATFPTASSVKLNTAVANGDTILIQRITPRDKLTVEMPNSGTFRGRDINAMALQTLFISQEVFDSLTSIVQLAVDNTMDALGHRISNVADPVNDQDAVTKKWSMTAMASELAQAIAAKIAAVAAQGASESARDTSVSAASTSTTQAGIATTKASAASTSASNANTSKLATDANAVATAADRSAVSTDKATVAGDKATVAADKATTYGYKSAALSARDDANAYKVAAASSAAEAGIYLADFLKRYYGGYAADPATDPAGNTKVAGALYWNTTSSVLKVWTGSVWIAANATTAGAVSFSPSGNIAATNVQAALQELDSEKQPSLGFVPLNKAGDTMTGNLSMTGWLQITGAANTYRTIIFETGADRRWMLSVEPNAETGGNVGSDLHLYKYSDAGTASVVFRIPRHTGIVDFNSIPSAVGNALVSSAGKQTLIGGFTSSLLDLGTKSSGTVTPDIGDRGVQKYSNAGAHTLAAPTADGTVVLDIVNASGAGAITLSGFAKVTGDSFNTTVNNRFRCFISRVNAVSHLFVQAMQ